MMTDMAVMPKKMDMEPATPESPRYPTAEFTGEHADKFAEALGGWKNIALTDTFDLESVRVAITNLQNSSNRKCIGIEFRNLGNAEAGDESEDEGSEEVEKSATKNPALKKAIKNKTAVKGEEGY